MIIYLLSRLLLPNREPRGAWARASGGGLVTGARKPQLWTKDKTTRRDHGEIPRGYAAIALSDPVEITIRARPPLRRTLIAWGPRRRLQRYRVDCTGGLRWRFSIRSHSSVVNRAVSSFPAIGIGIANRGDLRFCVPRLFQPVQICEYGGFQLHEFPSLSEVAKTLLALFESTAARAFSRNLAVALGRWSGDQGRRAKAQEKKHQSEYFHLQLLLPAQPGERPMHAHRISRLDAHWLYPGVIRVSGQYGSHVWSELLIEAEEGKATSWERAELCVQN